MRSSLNLPVGKREEKFRRKDGKSQGAAKPKAAPTIVSVPTKTPSPATTPLPTHLPPVVPPPTASTPHPVTASNVPKDPIANSPNLPTREGKHIRRKNKEKGEKDPPKTTIRKKRNSSTATQSISIDAKTSSENDGRAGSKNEKKKKNSQTSSDSARRKSRENKSDGSKEPSDNDEKKKPKKIHSETMNFFKHEAESKRARKRAEDARLETMPESSIINFSVRAIKKRLKKTPNPLTDNNLFKENGDPVWIVTEDVKTVDGVKIPNPELATAMAEDNLELDERPWYDLIPAFAACEMSRGAQLPENYHFDPFAPVDDLAKNSECVTQESVVYNTVQNLVGMSQAAVTRYALKLDGIADRVRPVPTQEKKGAETIDKALTAEQFQLKTCVTQNVTFDQKACITVVYDRNNPKLSIQKHRKRMNNTMNNTYSMEQSTQVESKEKL